MSCMEEKVEQLMTASFRNEHCMLDVPFCAEEIDVVLGKLKSGKSAGHDMLQAEHVKYGGPSVDTTNLQLYHRLRTCTRPFQDRYHCPCIQTGRKRPP